MVGIKAFGAYLPRRRLQRSVIAEANCWFDPSLKGLSKGERTMCSWDEDSITMGVEAAQDLCGLDDKIQAIILASTTLPFAVRQNAGIIAEALNLHNNIRTMDIGGSLRASTTSLLTALDIASAQGQDVLLISSDNRKARAGSQMEMISGDGAAALIVSHDEPGLKFLGAASINDDFIDHFRASGDDYDYTWEDRWIRQEGWLKTVPNAINMALGKVGLSGSDIDHLIVPCQYKRVAESIAKQCGINTDSAVDTMIDSVGICGTAHPLVMLVSAISKAKPGQKLVISSFGQGCDALVFEVTDLIENYQPNRGLEGWLNRKVEEKNYEKFLTFNGNINREFGKRAELDRPPALTAQYRNKEGVTGFKGGICTKCGTIQYPKSIYCVNPNCRARNTQESHSMSKTTAKVKTYTADHLVFSMEPPAYFGLIEFEGGGRMMVEFTDLDPESFDVGISTKMHFRIKHLDENRGMRQYFWKASPE